MHEVECRSTTAQGLNKRRAIEGITTYHFYAARHATNQEFGTARDGSNSTTRFEKRAQKPTTNVAACTQNSDVLGGVLSRVHSITEGPQESSGSSSRLRSSVAKQLSA